MAVAKEAEAVEACPTAVELPPLTAAPAPIATELFEMLLPVPAFAPITVVLLPFTKVLPPSAVELA